MKVNDSGDLVTNGVRCRTTIKGRVNAALSWTGENMTEINRRTLVKGAAWSVPVIAAAAAAPLASASPNPTTPWNLHVEASCSGLIGITSGGGFILTNTGSEPIPAGTTFQWIEQYDITGEAIWRTVSKTWVDTRLSWRPTDSGGFVTSAWSKWTTDDPWWALIKTDSKKRTVTYVVPEGGFPPGFTATIGWQTALMHSTFTASFTFISGNGGAIEGDESVSFTPRLIAGCHVEEPRTMSDAELERIMPGLTPEELDELRKALALQTP